MAKHNKVHKGKIPLALHDEVYKKLTVDGWTYQQTVDWLAEEHNVETSLGGVCRLLQRIRENRGEIYKEALSKAVTEAVPEDLNIVAETARMGKILQKKAFDEGNVNEWVKVSGTLDKCVELRSKLAQFADKTDGDASLKEHIEEIHDDLLDAIEQLEKSKKTLSPKEAVFNAGEKSPNKEVN